MMSVIWNEFFDQAYIYDYNKMIIYSRHYTIHNMDEVKRSLMNENVVAIA